MKNGGGGEPKYEVLIIDNHLCDGLKLVCFQPVLVVSAVTLVKEPNSRVGCAFGDASFLGRSS